MNSRWVTFHEFSLIVTLCTYSSGKKSIRGNPETFERFHCQPAESRRFQMFECFHCKPAENSTSCKFNLAGAALPRAIWASLLALHTGEHLDLAIFRELAHPGAPRPCAYSENLHTGEHFDLAHIPRTCTQGSTSTSRIFRELAHPGALRPRAYSENLHTGAHLDLVLSPCRHSMKNWAP